MPLLTASSSAIRHLLVLHSALLPPFRAPVRFRSSSIFKTWTGHSPGDDSVSRARNNDANDPSSKGAANGLREREESFGIQDSSRSQAVTEREGLTFSENAKKEHPKAPDPVIGLNDERGRVSLTPGRLLSCHFVLALEGISDLRTNRPFYRRVIDSGARLSLIFCTLWFISSFPFLS